MTTFACISDTHNWEIDIPAPADVLLCAGDFTGQGKESEIIKFNNWLSNVNIKTKIVIPGNHDLLFEKDWNYAKSLLPAATYVLNQTIAEVDGFVIYGEPRQPWFHDWAFNVHRDKMEAVWDRIPESVDILVTHGPPFGIGDKTAHKAPSCDLGASHVGCVAQRRWIEKHQPKLVVCGHIHEGSGMYKLGNTHIINAAICNLQYKPVNPVRYITL